MRVSFYVALAATLGECLAAPARGAKSHTLHEKRNGVPEEWIKRSRAHAANVLPVRIGLKQRNLEHAESYMEDVSNPFSLNFGKHWTAERVANTFAPSKETTDNVIDWLRASGISHERVTYSTGM